jgi:hypothetical protein
LNDAKDDEKKKERLNNAAQDALDTATATKSTAENDKNAAE